MEKKSIFFLLKSVLLEFIFSYLNLLMIGCVTNLTLWRTFFVATERLIEGPEGLMHFWTKFR